MENETEHLDPTSEITLETVKERSIKGVVTLTGRLFILQIISSIATLLLGALLTSAQFGIFGIVSAIINFLGYFSDIGLAASLIQKKDKVTNDDLKTTFTIQQVLVLLLLGFLFLLSPRIVEIYHLKDEALFLLYALGVSFLFSSLKTIPSVLLERELRFERLALSSIFETLVYNFTLVFFAWKGFGITSFTIAVLSRAVIGLVSIYLLRPWKPGLMISGRALRGLLRFGVPYQLNTFIAVLKDDGLTLVLGKVIGLEAMGLLIWAQGWAQKPLRYFMDTVTKVTFPAFARMQSEKQHLGRSLTRSIFFITFLVFPSTVGIVLLAPLAVKLAATVAPRYLQWEPAMIALVFVSVNVLFASFTTQLTNFFNATGRIKVTFGLMIMWAALSWLLIPTLGGYWGLNGAALGYALVGSSSVVAVFVTKRYVNFSVNEAIVKPLSATLVMGAVVFILRMVLPASLYSLWILAAVGVIVYSVLMITMVGVSLIVDAKRSLKTIFSK